MGDNVETKDGSATTKAVEQESNTKRQAPGPLFEGKPIEYPKDDGKPKNGASDWW